MFQVLGWGSSLTWENQLSSRLSQLGVPKALTLCFYVGGPWSCELGQLKAGGYVGPCKIWSRVL